MSLTENFDRAAAQDLDEQDTLAHLRERFCLPQDVIYLDGNSLGALPTAVPERLRETVTEEWGRQLIASWHRGWMELPAKVGMKIASLIGARSHEVLACDSTSVNLFKLAAAALMARTSRSVVLTEAENFPTDLYILDGLAAIVGREVRVRRVPAPELTAALDNMTALVVLSHVDYKSAYLREMRALTAAAQSAGAMMLWDLSHSVGTVPIDLNGAGADLAVGCSYKFLNGGPGAPAFLWVAERHHSTLTSPLAGWMGHVAPFDFATDFRPAEGVGRFACGTPAILGLAALDAALDAFAGTAVATLYAKAQRLTDLFIRLTGEVPGARLLSPVDPARRGSHVSLGHVSGGAIMDKLAKRGILGDFRPPDVMRFGFAPMYTRFVDVFDAATALREEAEAIG